MAVDKETLKGYLHSTLSSIRKQDGKYILYRVGQGHADEGVLVDSLEDAQEFMSLYSRMLSSGSDDLSSATPKSLLRSVYYPLLSFSAEVAINKVSPDSGFYKAAAVEALSFTPYNRLLLSKVASLLEQRAMALVAVSSVDEVTDESLEEHRLYKKIAFYLSSPSAADTH